jgi:hypothetical protein
VEGVHGRTSEPQRRLSRSVSLLCAFMWGLDWLTFSASSYRKWDAYDLAQDEPLYDDEPLSYDGEPFSPGADNRQGPWLGERTGNSGLWNNANAIRPPLEGLFAELDAPRGGPGTMPGAWDRGGFWGDGLDDVAMGTGRRTGAEEKYMAECEEQQQRIGEEVQRVRRSRMAPDEKQARLRRLTVARMQADRAVNAAQQARGF